MTSESRPPDEKWVPLSTSPFEPRTLPLKNPLSRRGKKPTREMIGTIKILAELIRNPSLNVRALASRTELDRSSTRKYCKTLVALRFLTVQNQQKMNQTIPMYSITLMGRIQLITSEFKYSSIYLTDADYNSLFHRIANDFPAPSNKPYQRFTKRLLQELLRTQHSYGCMVEWVKQTAKFLLYENLDEAWDTAWYYTISRLNKEETCWYFISINDALISADRDERIAVLQRLSFVNFLNNGRLTSTLEEFHLSELAQNLNFYDATVGRIYDETLRKATEDLRRARTEPSASSQPDKP